MGSRLVVALAAVVAFGCSVAVRAQNSTRKERRAPSVLAARAGSAVAWQSSVEAALTAAKAAHKRVFWYVPTVARSPMDRQPEIDRYLRGGPLSWPSTLTLLANHFVCTDEVPAGALQERFGLVRQKFIEPGYLVLDAEGAVQLRVDQLTTLHPEWFEAPLRRLVGAPAEGFPGAPALREAWQAYRTGDVAAVGRFVATVLQAEPSSATAAEAWWLRGASLFRSGEPSAARAAWRELAARLPDEPLAWKAQLEIEGHGPFVHGFEDYLELPAAVLTQDPVDGTRAPGVYDEAELWQRSVRFLLAMDDGTGMVRDSIYDFGGTDGLPNVWAATTCLVGMALLAADARVARKHLELGKDERRLGRMLQRIRDKVVNESWLALSDRDEIVWARAYAVRFLAAWARRYPRERDEVLPELRGGVGALLALQPETGVWFHEYGNPFATATALQALHEARELGCEVDEATLARGLAGLARSRTGEGAFSYGETRVGRQPRAVVAGAAGRMPLCELALFLFDKSDAERLAAAVTAGQRHHDLLAAVRKYDDHADRLGYGGFFFWFDMLGRTEAAMRIADPAAKKQVAGEIRKLVLDLPEFDGCFVDSHELGRCYGTAMALLCLDALRAAD